MSYVGDTVPPPSLVVRTVRLGPDASANLLDLLPDERPVSWLRRGEGLVGWGAAAEIRTTGATRFADADKWWTEVADAAVVRDEVSEPGTGLVAFGSFAFADEPGDSVLVAPEVVVGRRGDTTWLTTISRREPRGTGSGDAGRPGGRGEPAGRRPLRRRRPQR